MPTLKKIASKISKKERESENKKERRKIYNKKKWENLRKAKLIKDPLCEICKSKGIITPAEDVHHIISFMSVDNDLKRLELAYNYNNLQSICKRCHGLEHAKHPYSK